MVATEKMGWGAGADVTTVDRMDIDAATFSQQWARAWNSLDVDAVLAHFHDDAVFTSPMAAQMYPETAGVIRGRAALHRYWSGAVQRMPDLHFVVEDVYRGIDTIVINYHNQSGGLVNEVLRFGSDGLVIEGHATYLVARSAATA